MQFTVILLFLYLTLGVTALGPQCTKFPYSGLLFLSAYAPAVKYCSSKYPIPVPTCSTTTTKTSTLTTSTTVTETSTYYNNQKRAAIDTAKCSASLGAMTKMPPNVIQTACSCIETTPPCTTSTATRTNTATKTSTATVLTHATASGKLMIVNREHPLTLFA